MPMLLYDFINLVLEVALLKIRVIIINIRLLLF